MKKLLPLLLLVALFVAGCSDAKSNESAKENAKEKNKIVIGVSPEPHREIAETAKKVLEKDGIALEIKVFDDYVIPNTSLADGELDANFFQHKPYLEDFVKERKLDLVSIGGVHLEPMGVYSKNYKDLKELKDGDKVIIPNDPTNGARALKLLEKNGVIKLDNKKDINITEKDIKENPKNLKFTPLEAAAIPRTYEEAAIAVINSNYALQQGLSPEKDAIAIEDAKDNPYVNIIVVRKEDANSESSKKLIAAFQSKEVKDLIEKKYKGEIVPAF